LITFVLIRRIVTFVVLIEREINIYIMDTGVQIAQKIPGGANPAGEMCLNRFNCQAVTMLLAAVRFSFSTASSRMRYFRILPAAFMGNSVTKS